jgi:hypothetical protein
MSWNEHHSRSEELATQAESLRRSGEMEKSVELYCKAAREESSAFDDLDPEKARTRGITAVSAVALWYKGQNYAAAEQRAYECLATSNLPVFAVTELRNLLQIIWTTSSAEKSGVRFVSGDVLVSVKGGKVIHGGAPLELIVRKVEGIQAVLFRTVEMLLDLPFRRHGSPSEDVQSMFRPWLFQAPAGSYQFAVRMQQPEQMPLWEDNRPKLEQVTDTFFQVLRASATDPDNTLKTIVPDTNYRTAFLKLARNLSPSGKVFDSLEVRDASAPDEPLVTLGSETRTGLNGAIRKLKPIPTDDEDKQTTISGTLRALHLDQDWLEITEHGDQHVRIENASDALDDVVGPMVNRQVVVTAIRRGKRFLYQDIELAE